MVGREDRELDEPDEAGRPTQHDEARAEILNAAATAFMQKGFTATSIDDVADSLGATKGRIYHYYRSKTDIYLDIHLEALGHLLNRVGAIARQAEMPPDRRLFEMCREHVVVFMTTIAYQKATILGLNRFLLSITAPYQDEASARVQALRDEYENLFVATIEEGIAKGVFRPILPRFATKPLLGALNWANLWYTVPADGNDSDVERTAVALASYCVRALINAPGRQDQEGEPG